MNIKIRNVYEEYTDKKDKVINLLLERIATLEYEVERLENIIKLMNNGDD